jgi:hypothetical protein
MTQNLALGAPTLDLMGIRQFPVGQHYPDAKAIGDAAWNIVVQSLRQKLSPEEREILDSRMSLEGTPSPSPTEKQVLRKFDEVLIQEAETLGWRLYCCPLVMRRIVYWCDKSLSGLALLKRFHKAIELGVGVNLGETSFPINNPRWYRIKQTGAKELKYLLAQYREAVRGHNRAPGPPEICNWFKETVERVSSAVPYLSQNLSALLVGLENALKNDPSFRMRMASGAVSTREAPSLFDKIFSHGCNVTESYARKKISELRELQQD